MPLILGAQSATADAGYQIEKSCRFNAAASATMSRGFGSDGSLVACTINAWTKISAPTGTQPVVWTYVSGTNANLKFGGNYSVGEIHFYSNRSGESPAEPELLSDAFYNDTSAWYNLHAIWD